MNLKETEAFRMTTNELEKVSRRMLWVIPDMLLAMVGDYCMGIEPKDSAAASSVSPPVASWSRLKLWISVPHTMWKYRKHMTPRISPAM